MRPFPFECKVRVRHRSGRRSGTLLSLGGDDLRGRSGDKFTAELCQTHTRPPGRCCDPAVHTDSLLDWEGVGLMSCFPQWNKNPADKQTKENEQMARKRQISPTVTASHVRGRRGQDGPTFSTVSCIFYWKGGGGSNNSPAPSAPYTRSPRMQR